MLSLRKNHERGHGNYGWLDSQHTFSFSSYYDPKHMGFRTLRVINEDRVAPEQGFGQHGHNDMEIISYVVSGRLSHKDSMGSGSTLERGDVQVMSAGRGVTHSEFNGSIERPVHFLQIWIAPDARGHEPRYAEKRFSDSDKQDQLRLIVSPDGRDESLAIHQDARLYASILRSKNSLDYALAPRRHAWVQLVKGELTVNGVRLEAGDGVSASEESQLKISAGRDAEFLLFDLS